MDEPFAAIALVLVAAAGLRAHADLKKKVLWAGMGRHIELWSKPIFEKLSSEVLADEEQRQAMAARLSELGL